MTGSSPPCSVPAGVLSVDVGWLPTGLAAGVVGEAVGEGIEEDSMTGVNGESEGTTSTVGRGSEVGSKVGPLQAARRTRKAKKAIGRI